MNRIRCSALPRVIACPASRNAPKILIDQTSPEAQTGSALHSIMGTVALEDLTAVPEMDLCLREFPGADPDEVRRMSWNGVHLWKKLRESFSTLGVEEELADSRLTGHADHIGKTPESYLVVTDWKGGYVERDYLPQLKGYLLLAAKKYLGGLENFTGGKVIVGWLRWRDRYDVYDVSVGELGLFQQQILAAFDSDIYNPGEHCEYCPLQHECEARTKLVRQAVATFQEDLPATPEALARAYPMYQIAQKALNSYKMLLRQSIQEHGTQTLPDGRALRLKGQTQKKVMFGKGLVKEVRGLFGASEERALDMLRQCVSVSKGKLEKMVKMTSPPRAGGKNISALYKALEEHGLIEEKQVQKLALEVPESETENLGM